MAKVALSSPSVTTTTTLTHTAHYAHAPSTFIHCGLCRLPSTRSLSKTPRFNVSSPTCWNRPREWCGQARTTTSIPVMAAARCRPFSCTGVSVSGAGRPTRRSHAYLDPTPDLSQHLTTSHHTAPHHTTLHHTTPYSDHLLQQLDNLRFRDSANALTLNVLSKLSAAGIRTFEVHYDKISQ